MLDLHPLTLEDLVTQDPVEKCEEFQNYYVTSFKLIELNLSSSSSTDETIDLRRNIPDPQYTFVYNVIHPNCIVTFDYGNHSIQDSVLSLLQKPDYQKKIVPDWVGGVMLHSFIEHLDTQLKLLEQEIIAVNDFYLISEDFEGTTRHFSPKEGESLLPPRLTQLRKIASDFVEILEIKPNLFDNLLKIFGKMPYSTVSRPSSLYSSKAPSQIGTPARSSSPVRSLYESTRSLSPVPSFTDLSGASTIQKLHAESLEKGLSRSLSRSNLLDSTDIEIWINSSCTQIVGMLREAKLLQTILEKSFELQKTNWDFEMTYSATAFNDKLAFFSALTWAILPFSLGSLLMGMNVVVPGMGLPNLDGFVNTLGAMTLATLFLLYIARQLELV
jgi:Mg2+ and Co2+ transporter CorA